MKRFWLGVLAALLCVGAALGEGKAPVVLNERLVTRAEICLTGDLVIHDSLITCARQEASRRGLTADCDFSPMLSEAASLLRRADYAIVNVDGVFCGKSARDYAGYPSFNTPPALLIALREAGVDALSMANNHALDYWYSGLRTSIDRVEAAGLTFFGAARSQAEHDEAKVVKINGLKVGFLNYTTSLNLMERRPALDANALVYGVNFVPRADFDKDVRMLREAGAEAVICLMHWGTEYRLGTPTEEQKKLARRLMEAGVDVIVGNHPHVPERADWLTGENQFGEEQRTLCVYSLGNFLSSQRDSGRDGAPILRLVLERDEDAHALNISASCIPTWVWKNKGEYRVLPMPEGTARPEGMSDGDWRAMQAAVARQKQIMGSGSAPIDAE